MRGGKLLGRVLDKIPRGTFLGSLGCRAISGAAMAFAGAVGGGITGGVTGAAEGFLRSGWKGAWEGLKSGAETGAIMGGLGGLVRGLAKPFVRFVAGTQVIVGRNPDGSYITRNIEDLKPGDEVLSRDQYNEADDVGRHRVVRVFRHESDHLRVLSIRDKSGNVETIQTTHEHPFWLEGLGWVAAKDLKPYGSRDRFGTATVCATVASDCLCFIAKNLVFQGILDCQIAWIPFSVACDVTTREDDELQDGGQWERMLGRGRRTG